MSKDKKILDNIVVGIIVVVFVGIIARYIYYEIHYYDEAKEINSSLNVGKLKLMMPIEEAFDIFGEEENYHDNFWEENYGYPSYGFNCSVSKPPRYDLYNKIIGFEIENDNYSVFGISNGKDESYARDILLDKGYEYDNRLEEIFADTNHKRFHKGCATISFDVNDNLISKIIISITDKRMNPSEIEIIGNEDAFNRIINDNYSISIPKNWMCEELETETLLFKIDDKDIGGLYVQPYYVDINDQIKGLLPNHTEIIERKKLEGFLMEAEKIKLVITPPAASGIIDSEEWVYIFLIKNKTDIYEIFFNTEFIDDDSIIKVAKSFKLLE